MLEPLEPQETNVFDAGIKIQLTKYTTEPFYYKSCSRQLCLAMRAAMRAIMTDITLHEDETVNYDSLATTTFQFMLLVITNSVISSSCLCEKLVKSIRISIYSNDQ